MKRIFFVFLLIMTLPAISVLSAKEKKINCPTGNFHGCHTHCIE